MTIILLFCLPLIFCAYTLNLEDKHRHLSAFCIGSGTAALVLLIRAFVFPHTPLHTDTVTHLFVSVLFGQHLIPLCLGMLAALAVSAFDFSAVPSALFGVCTVSIYRLLFVHSTGHHTPPLFQYLLVYTAALFIFDGLLYCCRNMTFYYSAAAFGCFILFLLILAAGLFGIAFGYFNRGHPASFIIFAGIGLPGLFLHFFVHKNTAAQ